MARPMLQRLKAAASHSVTMIFIGIGALVLVAALVAAVAS